MNPICKQIQNHKRYVILLTGLLFCLAAVYMYLVSVTVMHVVVRKETTQSMKEINSQIAALETEYIKAQHAVSERVASLPDFVATPEKIFIERTDTTLVVRDTLQP
jgi:sensor c-di-GMP phosphodiesterase-like protein